MAGRFTKTLIFAALATACVMAAEEAPLPEKSLEELAEEPTLNLYEAGGAELMKVEEAPEPPQDEAALQALVAKTGKSRDQAQKKAERWERLYKAGVLSRVEAEGAATKALTINVTYQKARLALTQWLLENNKESGVTAEDVKAVSDELAKAEETLRQQKLTDKEKAAERRKKLKAAGLDP